MQDSILLRTRDLEITVLSPVAPPESQRFDRSCRVSSILLHGRHSFAQPEAQLPGRLTTGGIGLSSEFMCPWSQACPPGQTFEKFGVGCLTQRPEGGKYDKWHLYSLDPCRTEMEVHGERAVFRTQPNSGLISAEIIRSLQAIDNTLTLETRIMNTGSLPLETTEFNHNFLAIDNYPVGPGYVLTVPFDRDLSHGNWEFQALDPRGIPQESVPSMLKFEGCSCRWIHSMDGLTLHKSTGSEALHSESPYTWTLAHTSSDAHVTETGSFIPVRYAIWAVEHVVSVEVHAPIHLLPGEELTYTRTWCFED